MGVIQSVLAMGPALPNPDVPVTFGTGLVDDYDDNSGVWYNNNDGAQPGFFKYLYKWLPSALNGPSLGEILEQGLGPPSITIRMRVSGTSVNGSSGVAVHREDGSSIQVGNLMFIPPGEYATPTWFQSTTWTPFTSAQWDAWRTGDIRVRPITNQFATLKIYEVEITASRPVPDPLVIAGQQAGTRVRFYDG